MFSMRFLCLMKLSKTWLVFECAAEPFLPLTYLHDKYCPFQSLNTVEHWQIGYLWQKPGKTYKCQLITSHSRQFPEVYRWLTKTCLTVFSSLSYIVYQSRICTNRLAQVFFWCETYKANCF